MRNWQRWRLANKRMLIYANSPLANTMLSSGIYNRTDPRNRDVSMPLLLGEAEDTERAVQSLSSELRRAIEVWYLNPGGQHKKAKMCGCRREHLVTMLDMARRRILGAVTSMRELRQEQERSISAARSSS